MIASAETEPRRAAISSKGQKRATSADKEERILETMKLVIKGCSTSDVKRWFREEHGISWGHALRYLRLARERLAAETGLSDDFTLNDMKIQHYAIAMREVRTGATSRDRLAALKHAGAIYGVNAPTRIDTRVSGPLPPRTLAPDEMRSQVMASLAAFRRRNGNGGSDQAG